MNKDLISIEEATQEERKRTELDERISRQEQISWQIVVGVVIAFLFTIGLVGVEVMLFHTREGKDTLELQRQYFQEIQDLREKNFEIELRLQKALDAQKSSAASVMPANENAKRP